MQASRVEGSRRWHEIYNRSLDCVHCGLCVRYCDEVKGLNAVGFVDRGIRKEICLAYLPDIEVGDYAIVHVGFAISKIDEAKVPPALMSRPSRVPLV